MTAPTTTTPDAAEDGYRWQLLAALVTGLLGVGMTITVIALGVSAIAEDLGSTESVIAWGVTGSILGSVAGGSVLGKVADVYGRRKIYLGSMAVLVPILGLTALAQNGFQFVLLRVIAGVATGAGTSSGSAMLYDAFPGDDRSRAIGIFTAVMTGAPALGILFGGTAIDAFGWRPLFVVLMILAAIGLVVGALVIRPGTLAEPYDIDYLGGLLVSAGIAGWLVSMSFIDVGYGPGVVIATMAASTLLLVVFVRVERHVEHPIMRLGYFRRRNFILPTTVMATNSFGYMGGLIVAPILLTTRFGFTLTQASLVLFVRPAMYSVFSGVGGWLLPKLGGRRVLTMGASLLTAGLGLHAVAAHTGQLRWLAFGLLCAGIGSGSASTAAATLTADASDPEDYGMATGMRNMIAQIGVTTGIQVLTVILGTGRAAEDFVVPFIVGAMVTGSGAFIASRIPVGVGRPARQ